MKLKTIINKTKEKGTQKKKCFRFHLKNLKLQKKNKIKKTVKTNIKEMAIIK